jgi:hypothetical protein
MLSWILKLVFWIGFACFALAVITEEGLSFLFVASDKTPGMALPCLGMMDALFLYVVLIAGLDLLLASKEALARVYGIITLIVAILAILGGIALIFAALAKLILMVTLFMAVPFGTIAYIAKWGHFDTDAAAAALSLSMVLKLAFSICLPVASPRFVKNIYLVLVTLTSFLGNMLISFLHGIVPGVLVSITDVVGAIIVAILAVIWSLIFVIFAIRSIIAALHRRTGEA